MNKRIDPTVPAESRTVILTRMRFGKDDWWQFYDEGEKGHQVCRMEWDGIPGHDVWVPDGWVDVPRTATDEERDELYRQYVEKIYNGIDANTN